MSLIKPIWTVMVECKIFHSTLNEPGHPGHIKAQSRVEYKKNEVWTSEWAQVSLFSSLQPTTDPPSSSSLPAHYPCHTGPGPTWHSLVDLIELDIPACLGIVWWHENLPAISMKAEEKRGIGNTCRKIWGLEILRDGRAAAKRRTTSLPLCPGSVPSSEWASSRGVTSFDPEVWQNPGI